MNDARDTDTSKQTIHNSQKTKDGADAPWIKVSGKKRNRNSPEMSMPRKQAKMNRYQLSNSQLAPTRLQLAPSKDSRRSSMTRTTT